MSKIFRRPVSSGSLLLAAVLAVGTAIPWSDTRAQVTPPNLDFQLVDSGGKTQLRNSCFHLSASIGQVVPGYSSSTNYSLIAGFQGAASAAKVRDEIFFNGFEGC